MCKNKKGKIKFPFVLADNIIIYMRNKQDFTGMDGLILKFIWNCKGLRTVTTMLKKKKVRGFLLPDFKTY